MWKTTESTRSRVPKPQVFREILGQLVDAIRAETLDDKPKITLRSGATIVAQLAMRFPYRLRERNSTTGT